TAARMRADRIVVHPPDLDAEGFAGRGQKRHRLRAGGGVIIDVGVIAGDRAHSAAVRVSAKKRFSGRGRPRFSRKVGPSYSVRKMPRRCSSGTRSSQNSSSAPGRYGNWMV